MTLPRPTPIYRIMYLDNLDTLLRRKGMHATNCIPEDSLPYRTIHNVDIQNKRHESTLTCGPGGTMHDYVPFYFGFLSPMLLNLKTGRVSGYTEGQSPLIYLVSTIERVLSAASRFVFSDGHGITAFTQWFDDIKDLTSVDWDMVCQRYWSDNVDDMDRQRRKQAEFLVHRLCPWEVIQEIGVVDQAAKTRVEVIFSQFNVRLRRPVIIRTEWYYY